MFRGFLQPPTKTAAIHYCDATFKYVELHGIDMLIVGSIKPDTQNLLGAGHEAVEESDIFVMDFSVAIYPNVVHFPIEHSNIKHVNSWSLTHFVEYH